MVIGWEAARGNQKERPKSNYGQRMAELKKRSEINKNNSQ